MLLWITIGIFLIGALIKLIGKKLYSYDCETFGGMTAIVSFIILMCMVAVMLTNYIGVDASIAEKEQIHHSLVVQYKTGIYDESPNVGRYQLLQKIEKWNSNLAKMQTLTHDYWIGVFIPNYYDDLKFITINLFQDVTTGKE